MQSQTTVKYEVRRKSSYSWPTEDSFSTAISSMLWSQRKPASSRCSLVSVSGSVSTLHWTSTAWDMAASSASSLGLMVRASQPASASTSPVFLPTNEDEHRGHVTAGATNHRPEAGAHDGGVVAVLLVVSEDLPDGHDAGVLLRVRVSVARLGLARTRSAYPHHCSVPLSRSPCSSP